MQDKNQNGPDTALPSDEHELEQYGVWVKAEPQDMVEEPETDHADLDELEAFSVDQLDDVDLDLEDTLLSIEEEQDLGEAADQGSTPLAELGSEEVDDFNLDDLDIDELSIDDLTADSDPMEPVQAEAIPEMVELDADSEDEIIDIPLDDLDYEAPLRSTAEPEGEAPRGNGDSMDLTEISLDEFGLGMEDEAAPATGSEDVDISEFMQDESESEKPLEAEHVDIDELLNDEPTATEAEDFFEPLDIDLQFDDTIPAPADATADDLADFDLDRVEEEGKTDDFNADDILADVFGPEEKEVNLDFSTPKNRQMPMAVEGADQGFDDLDALERELGPDTLQDTPELAGSMGQDASSKLLVQIASELSTIKAELMSLRSQLHDIKSDQPARTSPPSPAQESIDSDEDEAAKGGFFDDEDDETIALTGDELNNILNTADFTEETLIEEELSGEAEDTQAGDVDLLPEDGDYQAGDTGIETIDLEEDSAEEVLDDGLELAEFEVPVTAAPEDTSYLEEEDLDAFPLEEPDLSEIDLSDVLVEAEDGEAEELPLAVAADDELADPSSEDLFEEIDLTEDIDFEAVEEDISLGIDGPEEEAPSQEQASQSIPEIEDLEDFELEDEASSIELHSEEGGGYASQSQPVQVHPDDMPMSLDDSFFVDSLATDEALPEYLADEELELPEEDLPAPATPPVAAPTMSEQPKAEQPRAEQPRAEQPRAEQPKAEPVAGLPIDPAVPEKLSHDIKSVLVYLDQLLSALPEEKIEEFASSEYYDTYKKLFEELGILE